MFTKGTQIEITRKAHPYTMGGYTDTTCIIPEQVTVATVKGARKTKNGLKVHFQGPDYGFAILVDNAPLHTFRAL